MAALMVVVLMADVSPARAVDLLAGDILAVDFDFDRVVRIDPITGDRTNISGSIQNTVGAGPLWNSPTGIVLEPAGSLVVSQRFDKLFRVNPTSGDRVILSDATHGTGPLLGNPMGIALDHDANILVPGDVDRD